MTFNYKKKIGLLLMSPMIIMVVIMVFYILKYIIITLWINIVSSVSTAQTHQWFSFFIIVLFIIGLILYNFDKKKS